MKRSLVVASALLLVAGSALAQGGQGRRGGGFMGGRMGGLMLLRMPAVQQELKMTQPQIDKLDTKQQEVMQAMRDAFQGGGQNATPEERQQRFAKVQEISNKAVADILDSTQLKRYKQLELQNQGPRAFSQKPVQDALQLTTEQNDKIAAILRDQMQAQRDAMQGINFQNMTDDDRAKLQATSEKLNADSLAKINGVLTEAQQKQYKDMTGPAFKFPAMPRGGFGGGRRPGA